MLFRHVLKYRIIRNFSTIDEDELLKFRNYAEVWWDTSGPMKGLHSLNKLRIPFIQNGLMMTNEIKPELLSTSTPLKQISVLDVGCGAGILSVGLAKLGCNVTGLDISPEMVKMAEVYADKQNLNIKYLASPIEEHAKYNIGKYDAIVSSEVIEHVTEKAKFVEACVKCLKPSGSIFITTINKTLMAKIYALFMVETVFRLLPKGTHEYEKLCDVRLLRQLLENNNCRIISTRGAFYTPFNTWHWIPSTSTYYELHAIKQNDS